MLRDCVFNNLILPFIHLRVSTCFYITQLHDIMNYEVDYSQDLYFCKHFFQEHTVTDSSKVSSITLTHHFTNPLNIKASCIRMFYRQLNMITNEFTWSNLKLVSQLQLQTCLGYGCHISTSARVYHVASRATSKQVRGEKSKS